MRQPGIIIILDNPLGYSRDHHYQLWPVVDKQRQPGQSRCISDGFFLLEQLITTRDFHGNSTIPANLQTEQSAIKTSDEAAQMKQLADGRAEKIRQVGSTLYRLGTASQLFLPLKQ